MRPALSGTILTYVFEVNEGAPAGETELEVVVDQVCNWQGEQLDSRCEGKAPLEVLPPKSDRAFLESLEPSWESCPHPFQPISIIIPWMSHIGCRALHLTRRQGRMERSVSAGKRCKKPDQRLRLPLPPLRRIKNRRRNTLWTSTGRKTGGTRMGSLFGRTDPIGRGAASSLFARRDRICVGCRRGRTVFDLSGKGGRGRFGQCQPGKAESRGDFDGNQDYRSIRRQKEPAGVYGYCEPGVGRIRFRRIIPVFSHRVYSRPKGLWSRHFPRTFWNIHYPWIRMCSP